MVSITSAQDRVNELAAELAAAQRELEKARALPIEPGEGEVVRFSLRYRMGENSYSYAAIKSGGLWYTTSKSRKEPMTWEKLVSWVHAAYWHSDLMRLNDKARLLHSGYRD